MLIVVNHQISLENLVTSYERVRSAASVDGLGLSLGAPGRLGVQNSMPSQPPIIEAAKIRTILQQFEHNQFFLFAPNWSVLMCF